MIGLWIFILPIFGVVICGLIMYIRSLPDPLKITVENLTTGKRY